MTNDSPAPSPFNHRVAKEDDIPLLRSIMNASISKLQEGFLNAKQVEASFELMGMDTQLIEDGTYYAILDSDEIVGCGGWSRRATLYGGNHTKGRNARLLDPKTEAARIRAMYTHPAHARRGIGRLIMELCEKKAAEEGFTRYELMATLSGEPLYRSCGYKPIVHENVPTSSGITVPLIKMGKRI
ncbi:GNAT family N-acetyltransferase [Kordiimonas sp.]|uniref:GNAT family N-acetyltransferase n=1 Tax=Kordiimonas sp. TaxID=1970157 RepID=UPI003B521E93